MRRSPWKHGVRSFTLLELLVVIAIIAVLAAMLTPALSSSRQRVNDIKCGQNQRQIQMALAMYVNDHDGIFPQFSANTWEHQYEQLIILSNTISKLDFFRCPSSRGDTAPGQPTWAWWSTTINGQTQWTEYKVNDNVDLMGKLYGGQLRPQKMVLVTDGIDWNPRHQGKNNLCFYDGHIELMSYDQYNDVEPGSTTGLPFPWYTWGINPD